LVGGLEKMGKCLVCEAFPKHKGLHYTAADITSRMFLSQRRSGGGFRPLELDSCWTAGGDQVWVATGMPESMNACSVQGVWVYSRQGTLVEEARLGLERGGPPAGRERVASPFSSATTTGAQNSALLEGRRRFAGKTPASEEEAGDLAAPGGVRGGLLSRLRRVGRTLGAEEAGTLREVFERPTEARLAAAAAPEPPAEASRAAEAT
jgi:hypothetical protein